MGWQPIIVPLLLMMGISFLVGAKVGSVTTESPMYHRDYKLCIADLPRNLDCRPVKVIFEEIEIGK